MLILSSDIYEENSITDGAALDKVLRVSINLLWLQVIEDLTVT